MFQSPKSGKFVSNTSTITYNNLGNTITFQSPRSGKFVSNTATEELRHFPSILVEFQSPRSGKFVSNK